MNHYEITVTNTLGRPSKSKVLLELFTVYATSPRIALRKLLASKRLPLPVLQVASHEDAMISLNFDVTNQGKVIRISELRCVEGGAAKVSIYPPKFHPADAPIPEGWAKVGTRKVGSTTGRTMSMTSKYRFYKESRLVDSDGPCEKAVGICTGCSCVFHEEPGGDISEPLEWREEKRWDEAFEEHVQFDSPDGCPDDSEYYLEGW